jgi:hypothetical protein
MEHSDSRFLHFDHTERDLDGRVDGRHGGSADLAERLDEADETFKSARRARRSPMSSAVACRRIGWPRCFAAPRDANQIAIRSISSRLTWSMVRS